MALSKRTKFHRNLMKSGAWRDYDQLWEETGRWSSPYESEPTIVPIRKQPKREQTEMKRKDHS